MPPQELELMMSPVIMYSFATIYMLILCVLTCYLSPTVEILIIISGGGGGCSST